MFPLVSSNPRFVLQKIFYDKNKRRDADRTIGASRLIDVTCLNTGEIFALFLEILIDKQSSGLTFEVF